MNDPIAFFLTISTYGTWLPGDGRGWVEYQHGWRLPHPVLELESKAKMSEAACILNQEMRFSVQKQVEETCRYRGWVLHAKNCRSNHLHVVISAHETVPKKIRSDIKAWCTRRLKNDSHGMRDNWWAERGSIRWVFTEDELERVIHYVHDAQDRKHLDR